MLLYEKRFTLLYAPMLLEELTTKLALPRIRNKYHVGDDAILALTKVILLQGEQVKAEETITVCRGPKDNFLLETAVSGHADYLVTTDKDLLVLHPFRNIQIVEPPLFLAAVETFRSG